MRMDSRWIWMDGEFVEKEKAVVPFLTPGLHYGIGVFEGIRCYETTEGPAVFRLQEHMARFCASAHALGFRELPFGVAELVSAAAATVAKNELSECYIRPLMTLAEGGWNLNIDGGRPAVGIAAWKWEDYHGKGGAGGIRVNVSSFTRHHPNVSLTKAKVAGNYPNSFLAKTESVRLGFDEAILLDPAGYVAECTGMNLFLVRGGAVVTPPSASVLEGITRDTLVTLAGDLGHEVKELPISRDQLYIADEVFLCGTAAEVVPVREVDFRTVGGGEPGPVTRALRDAYRTAVRGGHPRSEEWCHYVRPD